MSDRKYANSDVSHLQRLYAKLGDLQAEKRVAERKWRMQIDLVEMEIRRIVEERR